MTKKELEREKRSVTDQLLLANARKSPEEIEQRTGIPAREAMERLAVILRSRDWMTDRMEERLLLIEMGDLIEQARERARDADSENYSDIASVAMRGYEAMSKRISERRKLTEDDMNEVSRAQAEMFMEVLREFMGYMAVYFTELHPEAEIDWDTDINGAFTSGWKAAYEKVKERIRE